jgi:hypothetical protein
MIAAIMNPIVSRNVDSLTQLKYIAMLRSILVVLFISLGSSALLAQTSEGTRFWLAYTENIDLLFNGAPAFSVIPSAEGAFSGTVSVPQTGLTVDFSSEGGPVEVALPDAIWYPEIDQTVSNKGILIETDIPVQLTAVHYRIYFSAMSRLLPEEALGSAYTVLATEDENGNFPSQLVIVATADGTEIEIISSELTTELSPAGVPFTTTLDAGQIYQMKASGDLTGTKITTPNGEPIAVFAGAQQASLGCQGEDSHHWQQLFPEALCGTVYPVIPWQTSGTNDFKVVAFEDDTEVNLDCGEITTLEAGESVVYSLTVPKVLRSNKKVAVGQMSYSSSCNVGDAGSSYTFLQPGNYQTGSIAFELPLGFNEGELYDDFKVNLFRSSDETGAVTLNNEVVSFTLFQDNPLFEYARIEVAEGIQNLVCNGSVWATTAAFGDFDALTTGVGFDTIADLGIEATLFALGPPTSDRLCVGEAIDFTYFYEGDLNDFFWDFGDGVGTAEIDEPVYTYTEPGTYTVNFTGLDGTCPVTGTLEITIEDCDAVNINEVGGAALEMKRTAEGLLVQGQTGLPVLVERFDVSGRLLEHSNVNLPYLMPFGTGSGAIELIRVTTEREVLTERLTR